MIHVYALERQHQQAILQLITTMVTILVTYVVTTIGFAVHECGNSLQLGHGCRNVPSGVGLLAPAVAVGLLAFFTIMRVLFAASVGYTRGLEHDMAGELRASGTEPFLMPRSLVGETRSLVRRLPTVAFGLTYTLALGYTVFSEAFLVRWSDDAHGLLAGTIGGSFLIIIVLCVLSRPYTMRRHIKSMYFGLGKPTPTSR